MEQISCDLYVFTLDKLFDSLINSYIEDNVGIAPHFLSDELALLLKNNLIDHQKLLHLKTGRVGNDDAILKDVLIRNDKILWLDPTNKDVTEMKFFSLMDAFILHLNQTCFTGITGYEFHYTLYEKGSFYKKHIDQFQNNSDRAFSMILYLNLDWTIEDGGELCIHHSDHIQNISPTNGKCVFFKSNLLVHEVLISNAPRLSITGWLKTN